MIWNYKGSIIIELLRDCCADSPFVDLYVAMWLLSGLCFSFERRRRFGSPFGSRKRNRWRRLIVPSISHKNCSIFDSDEFRYVNLAQFLVDRMTSRYPDV
jgi:hypothetical protein